MTLTVVIPNYNGAKHLRNVVEQVMCQTRPVDEVIIIDDGSTDNSWEMLVRLHRNYPQIKIITRRDNRGAVATFNEGFRRAKSEWVAIRPVDDLVYADWWEKSHYALQYSPAAKMVVSGAQMNDLASGTSYLRNGVCSYRCYLTPGEVAQLGAENKLMLFTSGIIYHRATLLNSGCYIPTLRWHSDWWILFEIAFRYGFVWVPDILTEFNKYPASFSADGMKKTQQQRAVLRHALDLLDLPENSDIAPLFRSSGVLAPFGWPMLKLIMRPTYFHNCNWTYLKQTWWWMWRRSLRGMMPKWLVEICLKRMGVAANK